MKRTWRQPASRRVFILLMISACITVIPLLPLTKSQRAGRAILLTEREFERALNERRVEKLRELLAEDVSMVWQNSKTYEYEHSAKGREDVLAAWTVLLEDPNVRISWRSSKVDPYSDESASTLGTYLLVPLAGKGASNFGTQGMWWKRTDDGKWRIRGLYPVRRSVEKLGLGPW